MIRVLAIRALMELKSKKAVPGLLKIATERVEKDNADRSEACLALGILGDMSVVPDLVPLTYHYNRDTRFFAQISLVRLTGENFGRDVAAWRKWWQQRGGKPPIAEEPVAWATSPEMLKWAGPKELEAGDREMLEMAQKLSTAEGHAGPHGSQQSDPSSDVPCVDSRIDDIQPDGTARFTGRSEIKNSTASDMSVFSCMSSDFSKIEKVTDDNGHPLQLDAEHIGDRWYYLITLNEPVHPGQMMVLNTEGTESGLIKATGEPGVFKYHMVHSPASSCNVRRIEVHRLPAGAELLEKSPADMTESQSDGRIELRVERTIPPGGNIEVSYTYRLAGSK